LDNRRPTRLTKGVEAMSRTSTQLIHEGDYVAEVTIELVEDETGWSPHVPEEDVSSWTASVLRSGGATSRPPRAKQRFTR
jgi:hypothetical protein